MPNRYRDRVGCPNFAFKKVLLQSETQQNRNSFASFRFSFAKPQKKSFASFRFVSLRKFRFVSLKKRFALVVLLKKSFASKFSHIISSLSITMTGLEKNTTQSKFTALKNYRRRGYGWSRSRFFVRLLLLLYCKICYFYGNLRLS